MLLFSEVPCQWFFLNRLLKYYIVVLFKKDQSFHTYIILFGLQEKLYFLSYSGCLLFPNLAFYSATRLRTCPPGYSHTSIQIRDHRGVTVWPFFVYLSHSCSSLISCTAKVLPYNQKVCVRVILWLSSRPGHAQCIVKVLAETHPCSVVLDHVLFKPHLISVR